MGPRAGLLVLAGRSIVWAVSASPGGFQGNWISGFDVCFRLATLNATGRGVSFKIFIFFDLLFCSSSRERAIFYLLTECLYRDDSGVLRWTVFVLLVKLWFVLSADRFGSHIDLMN